MPASAANRGREMLMAERSGAETARDLDRVLADLRALSEDIESCAVLSGDGDLISSSHGPGVDRERGGDEIPVPRENGARLDVLRERRSLWGRGSHLLLARPRGG